MYQHFINKQFLNYTLVGVFSAFINWLSRIIFDFWTSYEIAVAIAFFFGMSCAFILNRVFIFPESIRPIKKQIRDFMIVNLINFPLVWSLAIFFKNLIEGLFGVNSYSSEIAHFFALSVPMFSNFLIYKFIAFGK